MTVRSPIVLNCLEGFMCTLPGLGRARLPLNSAMVITAPLPTAVWDEIGWDAAELLGDFAHAYIYAQRTADGRIALGGRGVPYRFGSRIDDHGRTQPRTIESLKIAEVVTVDAGDLFRGTNVPAGKYSLMVRVVFQSREATLTDAQTGDFSTRIITALEKQVGAQLRAS